MEMVEAGGWTAYVGCFTAAGCADPFEAMGGIPHDRSQVGTGVRLLHVSAGGKLRVDGSEVLPVVNPSYLFLHPTPHPHTVFVVSECEQGSVLAFAIPRGQSAGHVLVCTQQTDGGLPCHLESAGTDQSLLVVSNYGGSAAIFDTRKSDSAPSLLPLKQSIHHTGSSTHTARQTEAHTHSSVSRGHFVFIADLGMDVVFTYAIEESSSSPLRELHRFKTPPGSGPRSLALHPTLDFLAVTCELTGQLLLLRVLSSGELESVCTASLYPDGWPTEGGAGLERFNGGLWASDVCWAPGGKFVYAAARLHNSISVVSFDEERGFKVKERVRSGGETPRCLCMAGDGTLLLVAHHHGHSVCSFLVDSESGRLTAVDSAHLPQASCVKLLARTGTVKNPGPTGQP